MAAEAPSPVDVVRQFEWAELPVTGVYEVQDGLITYWRDYFDYPTIAGQLPTG